MKWSPRDDAVAASMKAAGSDFRAIGAALGRTRAATKSRMRWLSLTPEQRQKEARASHADRAAPARRSLRQRMKPTATVQSIPPEVLRSATRRLLAERSITAMIC